MNILGTYTDIHGDVKYASPSGTLEGLAIDMWIGYGPRPCTTKSRESPGRIRAGESQTILPDSGGFVLRDVYFRLSGNRITWGSDCTYQGLWNSEAYLITT